MTEHPEDLAVRVLASNTVSYADAHRLAKWCQKAISIAKQRSGVIDVLNNDLVAQRAHHKRMLEERTGLLEHYRVLMDAIAASEDPVVKQAVKAFLDESGGEI